MDVRNGIGEKSRGYRFSNNKYIRMDSFRNKHIDSLSKGKAEQVSNPTEITDMRKVIPAEHVDGMINDPKYGNVDGCVTGKKYVKDIAAVNDVIDSSRLDYEGSYFKRDGDYAYIDFTAESITRVDVPYGSEFGGNTSGKWPFTGSGFTAGENGTMVPEWQVPKGQNMIPSSGSTIHMVIDGKDKVVAEWDAIFESWRPTN